MTTSPRRETLDERLRPVKAIRVYFRQSKEQDQQKESVPTQRAECARLALALGISARWADRIEYIDIDRSGDDFAGREELQRLLREAQAGDVVLAWKQDRVGRDMIDSTATIRELVKYRGCALFTVETGTTPVTLDSAEQTAMVMFRGMVAQGELERIRSRTRDGLRQRARDGYAAGGVPFGYRTVLVDPTVKDRKQSKKRIEIDERLVPIVRRIFALYLEGHGTKYIAKQLNADAVPSPRGRGWSSACLWDMLRDARYVGEWAYGERRTVRREGRKVVERAAESEVIRTPRPDLAIISPDDWARVQTAMASRTRDMRAMCATARHMLSGTLRCDACGGAMRIKKCHGRRADWFRLYYVCGQRIRDGRCDNSVHLPAEEAEKKIVTWVQTTVLGEIEQANRDAIRAEVQRVVDTADARSGEVESLRAEVEDLRRERQRLVRLGAATDDPIPEVVDALRLNQDRAKTVERALEVASRPPIDLSTAERLESAAVGEVALMRRRFDAGEAREALRALFPAGLRFKVGNGLWLIHGSASVPAVRNSDNGPDTGQRFQRTDVVTA